MVRHKITAFQESLYSNDKPKTRLIRRLVNHHSLQLCFILRSTRLSAEERQVIMADAEARVPAALTFSFARRLIHF